MSTPSDIEKNAKSATKNQRRRFFVAHYVVSHWRGEQGFLWSFAVNLLGLRVIIFSFQTYFAPGVGADYTAYSTQVLIVAGFIHGVVLVWQIGGVLRAGEKFISSGGSMANVWGSYLGVLAAFWMSLGYGFDTWQWTLPYAGKTMMAENKDRYNLSVDRAGEIATISGEISPGLTKKFKLFLKQNPRIKTVVLDSEGGNIYEARGVSKLIRDNGFSTRVEGVCHSSCTIIFIGGKSRSLAKDAQLGFHKYRVAATYQVGFADVVLEQKRDQKLFKNAGVSAVFIGKMFTYEADELWFPDHENLFKAGVITTSKYNSLRVYRV